MGVEAAGGSSFEDDFDSGAVRCRGETFVVVDAFDEGIAAGGEASFVFVDGAVFKGLDFEESLVFIMGAGRMMGSMVNVWWSR